MESWVKREAEKRKEQERLAQQKSEARASRVKKIADKAPALWEKFAAVVENHVAEFNQLFRDEKQKLFELEKPAPRTLLLKRNPYPAVRMEMFLNLDTRSVNWQVVRTPRAHAKSSEEIGAIPIVLDAKGLPQLMNDGHPLALEAASELILKPVLFPPEK
ncbi:MAG: hypothetical protein ACRD2K_03675 [Terriglobales bacterium]